MSTIGIRGGGYAPPTTQSPVQQVPTTPAPAPWPGPVPTPTDPPVDPTWPGPPGAPPQDVPFPPNQGPTGPTGPDAPPHPPTLPPTQGPTGPDAPPNPPTFPPSGPDGPPPGPTTPPPDPTTPPPGPTTPPPGPGPIEPPPGPGPVDPPQPPTDPTEPPPVDEGFNWKPWLIGAGVVTAGVLGALAIHSGVKNVHALQATENAFASGTMHQGGLQAINDAKLGATFANGIGFGDYARVALPGVNRVGLGGRLTSVARGHVQHNELLAASTALRHVATGDGVAVFEPLRKSVFSDLQAGRGMEAILGDLDRSASGARPVFDNKQLLRYWNQQSIVELGRTSGGDHIASAARVTVPNLGLEGREIVETGGTATINQLVAGRNASLRAKGLASGIGSVQAANVSTLPPALQKAAIEASGVDPRLVETAGLRPAYVQRWQERVAAGVAAGPSWQERVGDGVAELADVAITAS
ncbi:MAG: hypothetical protein JWL76_1813 [Thermoleophilia bacterium]|nr:hypothetical protein [Thermoleophilia bacterium]